MQVVSLWTTAAKRIIALLPFLMLASILQQVDGAPVERGQGAAKFQHSPVVLIPGNGGSQLWAHLRHTNNHWFCQRSTPSNQPQLVWVSLKSLVYPAVKCLAYNLMLRKVPGANWNNTGPETHSSKGAEDDEVLTTDNIGVKSFVPGFGTTDTVQYITDWPSKHTAYYSTLTDFLTSHEGLTKNVTLTAAPYDFRKAPNELGSYLTSLTSLIEDTYAAAGGRPVVLVAHSMGARLALHFLQRQPPSWRAKYIRHFVPVGGAFAGVPASLMALLSGYTLGIPLAKPLWFRPVQRSWPSTYYLLPDPTGPVYGPNRPLVVARGGAEVYTTANISHLLTRAGKYDDLSKEGPEAYRRYGRLTVTKEPPGVPTTCVFGSGVATLARLRLMGDPATPTSLDAVEEASETGDGTVAFSTSDVCHDWTNRQAAGVNVVELSGAGHVQMLSDDRFVRLVAGLVKGA